MSKNIWIYMERDGSQLKKIGAEMITAAKIIAEKTGENITAVIIGKDVEALAKEAIAYGADNAIIVDGDEYENYSTESYTNIITELAKKHMPSTILIGATLDGKDFAPRCGVRLETGSVSSALDVEVSEDGKVLWTISNYGGNILRKVVCEKTPQIGTIRSSVFKKNDKDDSRTGEIINETSEIKTIEIRAKVIEAVKEISETVNLEEAEVIVAGGRGMGSAENFQLVHDFAKLLGGVVGATRAPIDSGWISRAHQIGQSGKSVAPKLYIACGISGATQHVAGISGSKYIVAINKDEEASIFQMANLGIVGNATEIIPIMMEEIKKII